MSPQAATPAAPAGISSPPGTDDRSHAGFVALLVAVVGLPLVVATVALRRPLWAPVLDLAMTELRVRDVGSLHSPLIGLPGRIGGNGIQGSHPGPLSFWVLAPVYRLAGASAWGLNLAVALLDLVAISLALAFASRRGGRPAACGVGLVIAVLVLGYGTAPLLEPWNPYMPLLWWLVVVVCTWSVLCGDLVALPVLVFAGSLCAQTHVPYLAICLGMGVLAGGALLLRARTSDRHAASAWRWIALAGGLGVVLWLPPSIDQLVNDPGNYRVLIDHFATPPEDPVGLSRAAEEVLEHFDLGHLVIDQMAEPGLLARGELGRFPVAWRGAALLGGWLAVAALTWRRSTSTLKALHVSVAVATVLGWYSISRIFGVVWYYLMLWLWAVAALVVVATVWSLWELWELWALWRSRRPHRDADPEPAVAPPDASLAHRWSVPVLVALIAAVSLRSLVVAPDAQPSDAQLSRVLSALVGPTADALDAGVGPAPGPDARYIVGFSDALHIGSQAYGLVSELERRGYDVGMDPAFGVPVTEHRTIRPEDADARIELVTGVNIDDWRRLDGVEEVATVDLRTPAELAELAALRTSVTKRLEAEGLGELVQYLDTNLFRAAIDQRAPEELRVDIDRMLKIGMPTSIFLAPATTTGP